MATVPMEMASMKRDIGVALSGGGFRAAAFHLGCLRALNDRGLLPRIRVMSGVSGGALLTALYGYGPKDFAAFDTWATQVLQTNLQLAIVRRMLMSRRAIQAFLTNARLPLSGSLSGLQQLFTRLGAVKTKASRNTSPSLLRHINRTTAFADVLAQQLFGEQKMPDVTHQGLDVVLTACDLVTGGAVRFGSRTSSISRLGIILDDVNVASAVAASAAFPVLLPALEQRYRLQDTQGREFQQVLLLTDGGVYDNLGLSVLTDDRDLRYTPHVYDVDYVIACDAGQGQLTPTSPHIWPTRMHRVVNIMHGRAQHGERSRLYATHANGKLHGFVYAYLGMQDHRMPVPVTDLVPRTTVADYPTDFRAMSWESLEALTTRGEQLVRHLLPHYCSSLC